MIAFGVGLPVFLASNENLWRKFSHAYVARSIAYLFLGGTALQVLVSLIDKYTDWSCLSAVEGLRNTDSIGATVGVWWQKHDWPSILIDIASIVLFGYANYWVLQILAS
jgi:hypothetical protein